MERQELFYPDIQVQIGQYIFKKGISLKTFSEKKSPFDWGRLCFTEPYKNEIALQASDEVVVSLGYDGKLQEVFIGNLVKGYDGAENLNEIIFKDRMLLLERARIKATYINCTPQEIIRDALQKAGITEYQLTDTAYPVMPMVPVVDKSAVEVLKQINTIWGIGLHGGFIRGVFYWGVAPDQKEILEFVYAENIISLDRSREMWELVTVSIPSMQHSQQIRVTHPKITGIFDVEKVIFTTNDGGFIRTSIYFKGA